MKEGNARTPRRGPASPCGLRVCVCPRNQHPEPRPAPREGSLSSRCCRLQTPVPQRSPLQQAPAPLPASTHLSARLATPSPGKGLPGPQRAGGRRAPPRGSPRKAARRTRPRRPGRLRSKLAAPTSIAGLRAALGLRACAPPAGAAPTGVKKNQKGRRHRNARGFSPAAGKPPGWARGTCSFYHV